MEFHISTEENHITAEETSTSTEEICVCVCVLSAPDKARFTVPALTCAFWLVGDSTAAVFARSWSLARAFAILRDSLQVVLLC